MRPLKQALPLLLALTATIFGEDLAIFKAGDPRAASIYDVKTLIHTGENTIAVTLANYGPAAGLNNGVALHLQEKPGSAAWSRSVFNGLAQIIVQSSTTSGPIHLTASAEGLKPAQVTVQSNPATPRPAVP